MLYAVPVGLHRTHDTHTRHTYGQISVITKQSDGGRARGAPRRGMREGSRVTGSTAFGHGVRAREHTRSQGDVPCIAQLAAREVLIVIPKWNHVLHVGWCSSRTRPELMAGRACG